MAKTQSKNASIELSTRAALSRLFHDKLFTAFLVTMMALLITVVVLLLLRAHPRDFAVPFRYSTVQGFDALGAWYQVYTYGLFAVVVTVINTLLAAQSYDKSRITSFFLIVGALVVNLFTAVVVFILTGHLEG